jgi:hypothetical protein
MPSRISVSACAVLFLAVVMPASMSAQGTAANGAKKSGAAKEKAPGPKRKPPIQASMVGYIDDAIVGSQIRVRSDAALGDTQPDLAEFFQAQAGYDATQGQGTPAGPKPGLAIKENFQQLYMRGEYAPKQNDRFSFIVDVPVRWVQPILFAEGTTANGTWGNQGGLSDVSAGFKVAAQESERDSVTFQFLATFPSGDAGKALGTAHYAVAPALLYYQKLTDRLSVESQISDSHPIGGDTPGFAGDVVEFGGGPGFVVYNGDRIKFAPVVEFVEWRIFGGHWSNPCLIDPALIATCPDPPSNQTPSLDTSGGANIINLKGGFRTSIGNNTSIYAGYGHVLTNGNLWYNQIFRVEFRRTF